MTLSAFKAKYRHNVEGDGRQSPFSSDQRTDAERTGKPIDTLSEEPWHPAAKIVNARITFPFKDHKRSTYTPTLAGTASLDHRYHFVDGRLYEINIFFAHATFDDVLEAMIATYEKPTKSESKEYQNALGAKFTGQECFWENGSRSRSAVVAGELVFARR